MSLKREFSRILLHQVLEAPQRDNFPERHMHGVDTGFHVENFQCFVYQAGVQPDDVLIMAIIMSCTPLPIYTNHRSHPGTNG
jgi:hypothetical protein